MPHSAQIRTSIVDALRCDLVGPFQASEPNEALELPPSRFYLAGFLAPREAREVIDPTAEEDTGSGTDDDDETDSSGEREPKAKQQFPASMGMSVLLPAKGEVVRVTVTFADYVRETIERDGKSAHVWRRVPRGPFAIDLSLDQKTLAHGQRIAEARGLLICGELETTDAPGLPKGARALAVFVVNERATEEDRRFVDEQFMFQVQLEVEFSSGFLPRPNRQGEGARDPDDQASDLQFRDHCEWAVGHGTSVQAPAHGPHEKVTHLRTTWIPEHEVRRVVTHDEPTVTTSMETLAAHNDLAAALNGLPAAYAVWIETQASASLEGVRDKARKRLVDEAKRANDRIKRGIALLVKDVAVREAFLLMNRAMAMAAIARSPTRYNEAVRPSWRLFQLAFVLLNLEGIANETSPERDIVELIFFPTGGGKTEAYLGVIALTLLLRRSRGQDRADKGLGVAVLLRYTLRLLTLDQLGRAATLVCALELLRKDRVASLGDVRFSIGLWVGRSATANTMDQVKKLVLDYKNGTSTSSPFPLGVCPWCGGELGADSLVLKPSPQSPEEIIVSCVSPPKTPPSTCAFSPKNNPEGIPVLFVDEPIYRELPAFIVATVDKFAMLPWRGETGMLFGRAGARDGRKFYGPLDKAPKHAHAIEGLRPPELIVQDELHLISGPLGTMVGLYETAVEHLSTRAVAGKLVRPKIIASTATVRRASSQIAALFGRNDTRLFPPRGLDAFETFFAKVDHVDPARLYVGVAAPGRSLKAILLRTYVALLAAAERQYDGEKTSDTFMSLVGYFNSLRELGGMRRLVEDDVRRRLADIEKRVPFGVTKHPWAKRREIEMPAELTSREKSGAIKTTKERLNKPHTNPEHVDVLLASNMISVGVDIDRLGLMVVAGQPRTTSEYIQATSRVGRDLPGLVVTCFNVRRPRDRSHYERFEAYHDSFYRYVEAASLTPFAGPALDRGLPGMFLAMSRLTGAALTPPPAAMDVEAHRAIVDACIDAIVARGAASQPSDAEGHTRLETDLRRRTLKLLEAWIKIVRLARQGGTKRSYSRFDKEKTAGKGLLYTRTDVPQPQANTDDARFAAPTSMRDVEPQAHLWLQRTKLGGGQ